MRMLKWSRKYIVAHRSMGLRLVQVIFGSSQRVRARIVDFGLMQRGKMNVGGYDGVFSIAVLRWDMGMERAGETRSARMMNKGFDDARQLEPAFLLFA